MSPALEVLATGAARASSRTTAARAWPPSGWAAPGPPTARRTGSGPGSSATRRAGPPSRCCSAALTVRARGRVTVALTGAPAPATVDGRPVAHATLVDVPDGAVLTLGMPATGLRTYLTVRGGIDVPPVLGSRSTDTLSRLGPPPVRVGDVLPVGTPGRDFPTRRPRRPARREPRRERDGARGAARAPGRLGRRVARSRTSAACSASTRRGLGRQRPGRAAAHRRPPCSARAAWRDAELPSEGMVRGAVQVPPGGEPVRLPRRPPRDRRLPRRRRCSRHPPATAPPSCGRARPSGWPRGTRRGTARATAW